MAFLLIKEATGQSTRIQLPEAGALTAGRTPENEIQLADARCSRRHFSLERDGNRTTLVDLGSANGTTANGAVITSPTLLQNGDIIGVGSLELLFLEDDGAELTPAGPQEHKKGADMIVRSVDDMARLLQGGVLDALAEIKKTPNPAANNSSSSTSVSETTAFAVLAQLARIILGATTSKELLESAVDLIFQVLRVQRVAVFLLEANRPILSVHRSTHEEKQFTVSSTILERAIQERVAISSGDARHDPRFASGESIAAWDIRSVMCVPLWAESEVYGALYLDNLKQQRVFTESDLELATGVANLVAIGLQQHQLKENVKAEAIKRSNLERYHSPDVVNMILSRKGGFEGNLQAATELEATILFSDIKGFTPLSERLRPAELAELLNWYFDLMTRIIFKHKGSVNKFIGDAIMAIFGAPISQGNDANSAVAAAVEMLDALKDFNLHLDERKRFEIRIGINTGPLIAGDIGARNRMEYTVIGDAVNTAQRLESICRPNAVTVGRRTFELVRDNYKFNDLGDRTLKGKMDTVKAYEVILS